MRVKIILHGALRKLVPNGYECDARTPAEAITALCSQFKLGRAGRSSPWVLSLVGYDSHESLYCPLTGPELHVTPHFGGGGGGGFFKIIIGAVLIAISFIPGIGQVIGATLTSALFSLGGSLVLGGLLELLSPAPKSTSSYDAKSDYLGAPKNTTAIGTPISIGYGRFQVYGQILSFDVESDPAPTGVNSQPPASSTYGSPSSATTSAFRGNSGEGPGGELDGYGGTPV